MTREISLFVNETPISLDYFVQGFIDHTLGGMVAALEGTGEVKTLDVAVEGDKVTIYLNGALVPTNLFASKIIKSTIVGMLSPLKGVGEIDKVKIAIRR